MRMKCITTYHLSPILLLLVLETASFAQVPAANKANAKVAGRIILDGKPALAIQVLLTKRDGQEDLAVTGTTDSEGHYQITNLAAGAYRVSVYAPAYVIEGESLLSFEYGKTVNITEGEQIENLDFSLMRGGVITGTVTDEYGKPVIAEGVAAFRLDQQGKRDNAAAVQMLRWQTDDRGVYRIFGLDIAEITPIVATRTRVVFILFSFSECSPHLLRVHRNNSPMDRWPRAQCGIRPGVAAAPHNGEINPCLSSVKAGTCRTRKLSHLLSRDVQATTL